MWAVPVVEQSDYQITSFLQKKFKHEVTKKTQRAQRKTKTIPVFDLRDPGVCFVT